MMSPFASQVVGAKKLAKSRELALEKSQYARQITRHASCVPKKVECQEIERAGKHVDFNSRQESKSGRKGWIEER